MENTNVNCSNGIGELYFCHCDYNHVYVVECVRVYMGASGFGVRDDANQLWQGSR